MSPLPMILVAALTFTACWLAMPRPSGRLPDVSTDFTSRSPPVTPRRLAGVAIGCLALAWFTAGSRGLIVGGGVVLVLAVVRRMIGDASRSTLRRARQRAVLQLCDALAAELRAGLPAAVAVERAFGDWSDWKPVVTASRLGGDVPAAIVQASGEPGAEGLRAVAAGWSVAGQSGAALAAVLDRVATGLRSDDEARAEVAAALGPPRATAKLLAVLPVFGLLLGTSMGAQPVDFLLTTTVGEASLALGTTLAVLGVFWVERLAAAAEL